MFLNHPSFKMDLKRGTVYTVQTGYKIWQGGVLSSEISEQEDGTPFEMLFEENASSDSGSLSLALSALMLPVLIGNMVL